MWIWNVSAFCIGSELVDLGQVQKGFIADIIAVPGNPLDDIMLLQQVDFVMKEGKVIKRPSR